MSLKRLVSALEVFALVAVLAFVVMLFANDDGGGGSSAPGAAIFEAKCAACHGADAGGGIGPKLAGEVTKDFRDIEDQIAFVSEGENTMPGFAGELTDEELRQVVEYTRSLEG